MKKFVRIVLIIAVWATVTWIFREKLLPLPKPDAGPTPHFRAEADTPRMAAGNGEVTSAPSAAPATPSIEATRPADVTPADHISDDLQQVKGIGPVYQHRLAEIGITSFDELLAADPGQIAERIDASESQVEEWIGQARDLRS